MQKVRALQLSFAVFQTRGCDVDGIGSPDDQPEQHGMALHTLAGEVCRKTAQVLDESLLHCTISVDGQRIPRTITKVLRAAVSSKPYCARKPCCYTPARWEREPDLVKVVFRRSGM